MDSYAAIAELYDVEHNDFVDDVDWYLHLASVAGPRVLELGCGSGRLVAPLVAAGNEVVGIDASEAMLRRARARLDPGANRSGVTLAHGDMLQLAALAPGPYDLVILSLNGLLHLETPEAQRQVLQAIARVLRPGGYLAIDVLHAVPDALAAYDGRVVHEGAWDTAGGSVAKFSARTVDWTNQLIATELWYDEVGSGGELARRRTEFTMRWLTPAELELLLELAGYADWSIAGGYDGAPLTDLSDRLLVVARTPE